MGSFSLLDLPAEIRMIIYLHLLSENILFFQAATPELKPAVKNSSTEADSSDTSSAVPGSVGSLIDVGDEAEILQGLAGLVDATNDSSPPSTSSSISVPNSSRPSHRHGPNPSARGILSLLRTHSITHNDLLPLWISHSHFHFSNTFTLFHILTALPTLLVPQFRRITIHHLTPIAVQSPTPWAEYLSRLHQYRARPSDAFEISPCLALWLPNLRLDVLTFGDAYASDECAMRLGFAMRGAHSRFRSWRFATNSGYHCVRSVRDQLMKDWIAHCGFWKEARFWCRSGAAHWTRPYITQKWCGCGEDPVGGSFEHTLHPVADVTVYEAEGELGEDMPEELCQLDMAELCDEDSARDWRLAEFTGPAPPSQRYERPLDRSPVVVRLETPAIGSKTHHPWMLDLLKDAVGDWSWAECVRQGLVWDPGHELWLLDLVNCRLWGELRARNMREYGF